MDCLRESKLAAIHFYKLGQERSGYLAIILLRYDRQINKPVFSLRTDKNDKRTSAANTTIYLTLTTKIRVAYQGSDR